jgi:hypothetical protein
LLIFAAILSTSCHSRSLLSFIANRSFKIESAKETCSSKITTKQVCFSVLQLLQTATSLFSYPNAIGTYNDALEGTGPCDSYDPTKVTASQFQNWPWQGEAVVLITTHPNVTWNFNVALFSEITNDQSHFIPLTEDVRQYNGTGILCFGQVPGNKEWVGKQAIVQILQHAPDGVLSTVSSFQLHSCKAEQDL